MQIFSPPEMHYLLGDFPDAPYNRKACFDTYSPPDQSDVREGDAIDSPDIANYCHVKVILGSSSSHIESNITLFCRSFNPGRPVRQNAGNIDTSSDTSRSTKANLKRALIVQDIYFWSRSLDVGPCSTFQRHGLLACTRE